MVDSSTSIQLGPWTKSRAEASESAAVEFTLTEEEFVAASGIRSLLEETSRVKTWVVLGCLVVVVLLIDLPLAMLHAKPALLLLLVGGLTVLLSLLALVASWRLRANARHRFNDPLFALKERQRIAATPEGLL